MKKIQIIKIGFSAIFFMLIFSFGFNYTYATDSCEKIVLQEMNFKGKASFDSNIRTYPCVYKSSIIRASIAGEEFEVIGKVDGWYKIKLDNGTIAWIWDESIIKTSSYTLSSSDKILVNKINNAIDKLIEQKGEEYKTTLKIVLKKALYKYSTNKRMYTIIKEILNHLESEKITEEENEIKIIDNYYEYGDKFDIDKVKTSWLSWHNIERQKLGLANYSYDSKLDFTAKQWSETSKQKGYMDHKRAPGDSYYDYWKITSWFKDRGVVCKNISSATHSESIGYGNARCSSSDCTTELMDMAQKVFEMYMAEKGTDLQHHYKAIKHNLFTKIGFGVAIDEIETDYYRFYFTTHYCTELTN